MQFLQFAAVVAGLLTNTAVNAYPAPDRGLSELACLFKEYKHQKITDCNLSGVEMPKADGLLPPGPDMKLARVVLGRGTQNYTCADSTDKSKPAADGAVATLYDASCLATYDLDLLHSLPDTMVKIPSDLIADALSIVSKVTRQDILVGHHYFAPNNTIPVFDFRIKKNQEWMLVGRRTGGVAAISTASMGGMGQYNGAVDWLRIDAIPSLSPDYKVAYRIHTAGGKPPATCKGLGKSFTIEYATEYCKFSMM